MKKIVILLCLFWMGFIFFMSSNNGQISHEQSTKVVNIIEDTKSKLENKTENVNKNESQNNSQKQTASENDKVDKSTINVQNQNLAVLDHVIRKNAHGFLYMVLAILVSSILFTYNKRGKDAVVYILFICQFYAVSDEFHQAFVPGRTSLVSDVLVDFIGTLVGIAIFYLFYYKLYRRYLDRGFS